MESQAGARSESTPRDAPPARAERRGIGLSAFEWFLLVILALIFAPAFSALSTVWDRFDYYSHGYMIPFAALWAATAQRAVLPTLPIERTPLGALYLALWLGVYLFGALASIISLQGLALVGAVASAIYFARGVRWTRALAFPIFYLLFMIPPPDAWLIPVIARLQLFVSATAIEIVHAIGMPVFREGNVIHLPGGASLFVADACSGITSIVTLVPLAVFLAYFTQRQLTRRLLLVASVIPLAMLGNLIRVSGTIIVAQTIGVEFATGDAVHEWAGIATYVLGCLALLAVGSMMERLVPEGKSPAFQ